MKSLTVTVTRNDEVTPLVTPEPEIVTVTVTNPLSMERGDSDRRTGRQKEELALSRLNGASVSGESSERETMFPKANALGRGSGGEAPATTLRRGDGDARSQEPTGDVFKSHGTPPMAPLDPAEARRKLAALSVPGAFCSGEGDFGDGDARTGTGG